MTQMILERSLQSRLEQSDSEVEFRDEQGQLVGYFVPPRLHREFILAWSRVHVSDEDLERARHESSERSLAELLDSLATGDLASLPRI